MPETRAKIAVIGGSNMDIGGFSNGVLRAGDSNPGRVYLTVGGVGRNIAENAARLGLDVELISAVGNDENGRTLLNDCRSKGIHIDGCRIDEGGRTSVYLFISDDQGDMHCAINDMEIQQSLTPEYLAAQIERLNAMDAVAIDANLPKDTICFLAESLKVPLFADAVSAAKADRLKAVLPRLACLKINRIEAELLTNAKIANVEDAKRAAKCLNDMGVRRAFVTLGLEGAVCSEGDACVFLPCLSGGAMNTTGAGDAFTAALIWAHCEGLDLRESGMAGISAARICVESMDTVSREMSRSSLLEKMAELAAQMKK